MKKIWTHVGILSIVSLMACQTEIADEGFVNVEGGRIWYKIVGEGEGLPLLILHGGPGSRSCTMMPGLSLLANERSVIFYDQLGSGRSDRPVDTSLWRIERFVGEIGILRDALDLDSLHILGHSCGSTFLMEYLVTDQPEGVASVIFSSPMLSTKDWVADARILLSQMPGPLQDTIAKYERLESYEEPAYISATDSFYTRFLSRKNWPYQPNIDCEGVRGFNTQVYNHMWGPTEFTANGTLENFDRTGHLEDLAMPVLFVTGEYDEARPETMYKYQDRMKNTEVRVIEDAAHMTMIDQPEKLRDAISDFLKEIERKK